MWNKSSIELAFGYRDGDMGEHGWSWAKLGRALLIALLGHGWLMIAGLLVIVVVTYAAVIVLVSTLGKERGKIKIVTPFLTVIAKSNRDTSKPR